MRLTIGCSGDLDFSDTPPPVEQLQEWGLLLEGLLGSSASREFTFPYILRRVETLSILSANGEGRHLSLDVDAPELRKLRDSFRLREPGGEARASKDADYYTDYGDLIPVPFAIFSKGILIDFSARADGTALALERKNTCWMAGYAWLLQAAPNPDRISGMLLKRLWWICRHQPNKAQRKQLEPDGSAASEVGALDREMPEYWGATDEHSRLIRDEAPYDEFFDLLFANDAPTTFYHRLLLLSINYFPLALVPVSKDTPARLLLKFDFLYGDSEEEWYSRKLGELGRQTSWFRRYLLPHGPWPWEVQLFGELEGHCEHLHISLPPGVELAGGRYWPDDGALKWFAGRLGAFTRYVRDRVLPSTSNEPPRPNSPEPEIIQQLVTSPVEIPVLRIQSATHHKFFRNVVTIRRHVSIPRGGVRVRFGIVPVMNGVFPPLMIALSLVLINLGVPVGFWILTNGQYYNFGYDRAGIGVNIPLWVGLISSVIAVTVRRLDEPLRIRMLNDVYGRTLCAVIFGSLTLWAYTLVRLGTKYLPDYMLPASFCCVVGSFALAIYAWIYLLLAWTKVTLARRKLRSSIGHTRELPVSP